MSSINIIYEEGQMKILYITNGNGLSDKIGGSLICTIDIAKRFQERNHKVHFLTTIGGYKACKREGLTGVNYFDRFLSYIISTLASIFIIPRLPHVNMIYTDSDYLCGIISALLYKLKLKFMVRWVASVYHLIPATPSRPGAGAFRLFSMLSCIGQQVSLVIINRSADLIQTETDF